MGLPYGTWFVLDQVLSILSEGVIDPMDVFVDEQKKMVRIEEAKEARIRKLTSIWSGEVFPAGFVILQQGSSHRIKHSVMVAVTEEDFVVLNAEVVLRPRW